MAAATIPVEIRIRDDTIRMMELAGQLIADSVRSLDDRDIDLAKSVAERDDELDRIETDIESMCVDTFAKILSGRPLRFTAATYKMAGDLERIGDYAVAVANVTLALENKPLTSSTLEISRMAAIAEGMLDACRKAYGGAAPLNIRQVFDDDVKMDDLYNDVFHQLLTSALEEPEMITNLIYLLIASRALERVGDHITNIAERIAYIETGQLKQRDVPMHVPQYPGE